MRKCIKFLLSEETSIELMGMMMDMNVGYIVNRDQTIQEVSTVIISIRKNDKPCQNSSGFTPHYLRHNYCTLLYDSGVDVQTAKVFMGHSKIETTMSIYTHCSESRRIKSSEKIINI